MQEVFIVGARNTRAGIKLSSDFIRIERCKWMLTRANRVEREELSWDPNGVVPIKGRVRVLNKRDRIVICGFIRVSIVGKHVNVSRDRRCRMR